MTTSVLTPTHQPRSPTRAYSDEANNDSYAMMLPEATLCLTLPSIHDGTPLECRIYHPRLLLPSSSSTARPPSRWGRHAAIVAHPYAPLGGCYDDITVHTVAEALLRLGYLVVTFNFRSVDHSSISLCKPLTPHPRAISGSAVS